MKNLLTILTGIFAILPLLAQDSFTATRANSELLIDGYSTDWDKNFHTNEEGKISFSVCNDNEYFYLCIQTFDRATQQKITRSGMTVNLSAKGEKKIKATINYPLKSGLSKADDAQVSPGQQGQDVRQQMRQLVLDQCLEMKTKGLFSQKGTIPSSNENGINAVIKWETEQLLTYELSLPLKELFGETFTEEDLAIPINIKIIANAIPQPQPQQTSTAGGGGGGRGGRGGRGGGGSQSSRGGQMNRSDMFIVTSLKYAFTLNTGK